MKKTKVKKTKPSKASDNGSQKSGFFSRSMSKSPSTKNGKSPSKKKGNENVSDNSQIISDFGYEPKGSIRTPGAATPIAETGNMNQATITPIIEEVKDDAAPSEPTQTKKMFKNYKK